jgi:hypothetical protein
LLKNYWTWVQKDSERPKSKTEKSQKNKTKAYAGFLNQPVVPGFFTGFYSTGDPYYRWLVLRPVITGFDIPAHQERPCIKTPQQKKITWANSTVFQEKWSVTKNS